MVISGDLYFQNCHGFDHQSALDIMIYVQNTKAGNYYIQLCVVTTMAFRKSEDRMFL